MNRKSWKNGYKKFGINKLKRVRAKLTQGHKMERKPNIIKTRRETI